ncbi:hypothetical protein IT413_01000 [Candidatus Peregrinibacteria bacterium]|nr:hypothetical protein [Candidatus Peregrinibacteria bacterium]
MSGEKQKSDLPILKTDGDKKFQKDMEQRLVIDTEGQGDTKPDAMKSWEKLLARIDESVKSDKNLRETIRKASENPELSKELRDHLRKLVETADARDQELEKSESERKKLAGDIEKPDEKKKPDDKPKFKPAFSANDGSEKKPGDKVPADASADKQKPGEAGAKTDPNKKEKSKEPRVDLEAVKKMSMGELLGQMFESLGRLSESFGAVFGNKDSKELAGKTVAKFSDEELQKIALDLQKGKDTKFTSQDQATEYVCGVLNLPLRKTPQEFLHSLQLSGLVLEQDMDRKKEMKVGDVIFFQKAQAPGVPAYIAVVSSVEPYRITTVPENGGIPSEMLLDQSSYFKNGWYGFIKIPRKEGQAPPAALQKP